MSGRKLITLGCLVAVGLVFAAGALPAQAQYYSYYPAYAAPVYVAPAPVYYAPPPVYYAPPPVVYAAPAYRSFGFSYRSYPSYYHHRGHAFGFGYRRW